MTNTVTKQWYVIHDGVNIIVYGNSEGKLIRTSSTLAEFDTEEAMNKYILDNKLIYSGEAK